MSTHLTVPLLAVALAVLFVLLACVAVLANVWVRAGFAALGLCLRGAHRLGIYEPDPGGSDDTERAHERVIHLFTRALRFVSRWTPGRPRQDTRTTIIPLLVVGIPVITLALLVLWAVPITLFGYVLANSPAPWSTVLAFVSLFAYFGISLVVWRVVKRASSAVGTATEWLGRRA